MRLYGRALSQHDLQALELAVAADQLGPDWPHERGLRSSRDWKSLTLGAWVGRELGIDWSAFMESTLISLAERSQSNKADGGGVRGNWPEVEGRIARLLSDGPFARAAGNREFVPVWVAGDVELVRRWDDESARQYLADSEQFAKDLAQQAATVERLKGDEAASLFLASKGHDFDMSRFHGPGEWFPWFPDGVPTDFLLWEHGEAVQLVAGAGVESSEIVREYGFRVGSGADDAVLIEGLRFASIAEPDLMGVLFRAVEFWDGDNAARRLAQIVVGLDDPCRSAVDAWRARADARSDLGDLVATEARGWLTFSPKWRPEAPWWDAAGDV